MCMTNLSIYTFIHLNIIVSFKLALKHAYPPPPQKKMVTDALSKYYMKGNRNIFWFMR